MKESAIPARNFILASLVDGAIKGTYESLRRRISRILTKKQEIRDVPLRRADLTEANGLLRRQVDQDEAVGAAFTGGTNGVLLAEGHDGVVVAC